MLEAGRLTCSLPGDGSQHALKVVAPVHAVALPASFVGRLALCLTRLGGAAANQFSIGPESLPMHHGGRTNCMICCFTLCFTSPRWAATSLTIRLEPSKQEGER